MTENKLIIDGIDVSGCDFLVKEDDYCSYSGEYRAYKGQCGCSDDEMCKDHPNCFYKKALKQLEQLKADNKHLNDLLNQALKELEQSREAVEKIKDIAENFCKACKEFVPNKCNEINRRYCNYNKIIQKCEEVDK